MTLMPGRRSLAVILALGLAVVAARGQQSASGGTPPPSDGLNLRFANGVAAIVEDKVITVDDVRHAIQPLIPELQKSSRNEKEFNERLEALQDDVIQNLIDKVLIVKEFNKDDKKHIPDSFIDSQIASTLSEQFEGDRSKFLAYLRSRSMTLRDYRKEVGEDIIENYMRHQQRKSQSIISPVRIETFYKENKERFNQEDSVHLRLIQFTRTNNESDAELRTKSEEVIGRFKRGEKFEALAKEYSQDSRKSKGGDWGVMKRSDLKPEFSDPLFALKAGEISEPIILPEGGFLLYVEDRKYAGLQPLSEVRDDIERILVQQMGRVSEERWLERLRRNGYIKRF